MINRIYIAILDKSEIDRLIYPLCLYIKNTPDVATVLLPPLMPINHDGETTHRADYTDPIQLNNSPNNNPISFTTGVKNQDPITYKLPYTLFVFTISPLYISSRYATIKYCLFYVNLTFASNDYAWNRDGLFKMSID